jgi:hypothetical protein
MTEAGKDPLSSEFKDSRRAHRGSLAEYLTAERLALLGWTVYLHPLFGCPKVDLLAAKDDRYLRIQVKTATGGHLDLRTKGGRGGFDRPWGTIVHDVDTVVAVVPSDITVAEMFRADYFILPSKFVSEGPGQYRLFAPEFQRFRNNWTILDEYHALADFIVVPNEGESEGFRYLPDDGKLVFEVTGKNGKCEIIVANCAKAWKHIHDRFGEDPFIRRFCQMLTEASIHGLCHQIAWNHAGHHHIEMTMMVRRLAWETG